ncbi:hypothetical protein [Dethiosulfatarculus sandiegensis]|uniref:Uncharacterized protein n=1 Tax=Dethiosulfatarculus sandiegensis TaxID=1429043 RepID=A0A0D2GCD7_9BACT|nr:hypothetical protein [Dethiosulfatarculus sandiegensis]KIX12547.1 hypothetical protein X474_18255 [Dethiosulfatarculus sandiegensis]
MNQDNKSKKDQGPCQVNCPLARLAEKAEKCKEEHRVFFDHLKKAENEFLLAVRSLLDDLVEEKKEPPKTATKIKIDPEESK